MRRRALAATLILVVATGVAAVVAVRAFVDANPARSPWAWEVLHDWHGDWRGVFAARTADADGLRIRDAFGKDRPPLRFETNDADVARGFLDLVRIADRASGFGCTGDCCSGEYTVDVLRGTSVAVSFNITSGRALRSGQLWPRDATLTPESAEAVCAWLVAHGVEVESPRKAAERIAAETDARDAAQDAFLGPERARALRACPDDAAVAALLADWAPDATDRIALAVRFLALEPSGEPSGADDAGARAYGRVESWLWHPDDFAAYVAAFDRLLADEAVAATAAYQFSLINGWHGDELPAQGLPELRMKAAQRLMVDSSDYRRACGVELLDWVGDTPEVRAILLGLLPPAGDGGRPVSPTTEDQMEAASGVVRFCDPSMFPRLQAMADAAKDTGLRGDRDHWAKRMAHRIAARRDPADADPLDETMDVLPRSPMEGVVRAADGTVVAGASVRLTEPRISPTVGEFFKSTIRTDTDERGHFHLDVPVGQKWHLSVVHDDHPYLLRRDVDLRDPPPAMDLVLPKERTIRGRVLDADGRPLPGAEVFATRQSPFDTHANECGATAAQDGAFEIRGFDADAPEVRVTLHVHEPGRDHESSTSERHEFTIRPGDPPVELRLRTTK